MIYLYDGTNGSGKSLHAAQVIRDNLLWTHTKVIANFPIKMNYVWYTPRQVRKMQKNPDYKPKKRKSSLFYYVDDAFLTPKFLVNFAKKFNKPRLEHQTLVVIDECQADWLFGNRAWQNKSRQDWCRLFQVHRHMGYDFILITPSDKLIDKAIRCLIEYEVRHRKITNYGIKGKLFALLLGGSAFVSITVWYSVKEKISSHFFRYKKMYADFYDSYRDFTKAGVKNGNKEVS